MKDYLIYITDTFGGNLNYCWVTKFKVKARTERGAVWKVSKETGLSFRHQYDEIWKDNGNCIGLVFDDIDYPQYDYESANEL